jgi:hypothetical protein
MTSPARRHREAELARRHLPDGRTWLAAAAAVCADLGELLDDVLELRRSSIVARARAYCELLEAGYSYPLIARGWCVDHSSVMAALKKYHPDAVAKHGEKYREAHGGRPGLARCEVPAAAAANTGTARTG